MVFLIKKPFVFLLLIIFLLASGFYFYHRLSLKNNQPINNIKQELSLSNTEKEQMFAAAQAYIKSYSVPGLEFELRIIKIINQWALLDAIPKNKATDNAGVIMEKVNNQWVARAFGTIFPEWSQKVPELFK